MAAAVKSTRRRRGLGNVEIEQELLTAVMYGWRTKEVDYAMEKLTQHDFLMPEHAQLFAEYRAAHESGVPLKTGATLKEWLSVTGGLARLAKKGQHETERAAMTWVIAMHLDYPGMVSCVPYYCYVLRKYRIERATQHIKGLEGTKEIIAATKQLERLDRLEDWKTVS